MEKRTKGALKFEIYPGSSLVKTNSQFSALRKGALDLSLVPISYAGGELPELNIGLMPGLVTSYEQSATWKKAEVGQEFSKFLLDKGVVMLSWIWQAGGVASRNKPIIDPEDAKGLKVRGGSREMDLILKEAGAAVVSIPSNEIYTGMQTGALDAAMTSSTSLISFHLEEVSKALTTGRGKAYWFMLEPLLMSRAVFDKLTKDQQQTIMAVGAEMEQFGLAGGQGRRQRGGQGLPEGRGEDGRPQRGIDQEMASHRPHRRLEGLRLQDRDLRQAAGAGREDPGVTRSLEP